MAYKFVIFLGLLNLVAEHYTVPTSSVQESLEEKMAMKSYINRMKIVALVITEASVTYEEILEKVPNVLNGVLKDPKLIEFKTEAMRNNMNALKDFLDSLEKLKEEDFHTHSLKVFQDYNNITEEFYNKKSENLSTEAAIIGNSLHRNGFDDIEKSITTHYETIFQKSSSEFDEYINGLNEEERNFESKLIDWYEKFKQANDIETKIQLCNSFPKRDFVKDLINARKDPK